MKLLYCDSCGDVFNLQYNLKSCSCGKVKGKYVNRIEAVVNGQGFSLAIGNGSLDKACIASISMTQDIERGHINHDHPTAIMCWARPHEGPANMHTNVDPNL